MCGSRMNSHTAWSARPGAFQFRRESSIVFRKPQNSAYFAVITVNFDSELLIKMLMRIIPIYIQAIYNTGVF